MVLLFPGRHQVVTNYQFQYLYRVIHGRLSNEMDIHNRPLDEKHRIDGIIFAVTSANHSNTRRNPLPFYLRTMELTEFSKELGIPCTIYGIDDVGIMEHYADYVLKRIAHLSDGRFQLTPENTLVLCSTPVYKLYEELGFRILPCELKNLALSQYEAPLPWDVIEKVAIAGEDWMKDPYILNHMHPASLRVWTLYNLGQKVQTLFGDKIIGQDGDITATRDYSSYVRQMDENSSDKFKETSLHIKPGRIGDIGCAVGSWIKSASQDERLRESDFYGIEVTRKLFDICEQRKANGEFANPFVFFSQKNAVSGLVFGKSSMDTIHTSSLTHEILSYGGREDLDKFIKNRYEELVPGGVWINRDVVGPENGDKLVYLYLNRDDGLNDRQDTAGMNDQGLNEYLSQASSELKFLIFSETFRIKEDEPIRYTVEQIAGKTYYRLTLRKACEFMYKKDYCDNWRSEMHELFCFWDFTDWKTQLSSHGFRLLPQSHPFRNSWIVENRFKDKVQLFEKIEDQFKPLEYPDTHMIIIAEKL